MAHVVNSRLQAAIETQQHEILLRVERIADNVDQIMQRAGKHALAAASDTSDYQASRAAADALHRMIPASIAEMDLQFRRLLRWTDQSIVGILAKKIPRRWYRSVLPAVVLLGESIVTEDSEPVASDRMSDEEWEAFLRMHMFPPPTLSEVNQVLYAPLFGKDWRRRMDDLSHIIIDMDRLAGLLATGASQGQTQAELARQLQPLVSGVKASARRIARTEGLRIATMTQRAQYEKLGDMMAGVQIHATLDENTRPAHAARDGTIFWTDRTKTPTIDQLPVLPDAPNCRCYDAPVLHPPEGFEDDPQLRAEFANAAGAAIPDPMVYSQWFANADPGRRKMAVGVKRYNMLARRLAGEREPQFADFISRDGQLMSLRQLQRESPKARQERLLAVGQLMAQRRELLERASRFGFIGGGRS